MLCPVLQIQALSALPYVKWGQCLAICSSYFCNESVCTQLVVSAIAECDFEENHLCGYVNRWNPNVNWFVGGGNIRNSQSILPKDHTLNSALGEQQM